MIGLPFLRLQFMLYEYLNTFLLRIWNLSIYEITTRQRTSSIRLQLFSNFQLQAYQSSRCDQQNLSALINKDFVKFLGSRNLALHAIISFRNVCTIADFSYANEYNGSMNSKVKQDRFLGSRYFQGVWQDLALRLPQRVSSLRHKKILYMYILLFSLIKKKVTGLILRDLRSNKSIEEFLNAQN